MKTFDLPIFLLLEVGSTERKRSERRSFLLVFVRKKTHELLRLVKSLGIANITALFLWMRSMRIIDLISIQCPKNLCHILLPNRRPGLYRIQQTQYGLYLDIKEPSRYFHFLSGNRRLEFWHVSLEPSIERSSTSVHGIRIAHQARMLAQIQGTLGMTTH